MKERIITALCLIAVVVPAVVFGGIFYKIFIKCKVYFRFCIIFVKNRY